MRGSFDWRRGEGGWRAYWMGSSEWILKRTLGESDAQGVVNQKLPLQYEVRGAGA
jgi:hypothetical protein